MPTARRGSLLAALPLVSALAVHASSVAASEPPAPYGPVPSARQLLWHERELYGFLHFTVNTFTDKEWGYGDEPESVFAPTAFDADQIVGAAKAGGLTGLILTAKHHDGFCLWPSRLTEHSVKRSPWRDGKGDVVREIAEACRRHGLAFGVYLSPWDRNHPEYGRPAYLEYYRGQLRELMTGYGPLFEVWFDGANGGDGYYGGAREKRTIDRRTYYGWPGTWQIVRDLQPDAMMFSDAGPDVRWVGNEKGVAGDPSWSTLNRDDFAPGEADEKRLNAGDRPGTHWLPAECDVSIRPGWFYHASEDDRVKTPYDLFDLYFESVGRGASLLLNIPPDRRGRVHERDEQSLRGFRRLLDATFGADLARGARASASNVRGGDERFAAANVLDGRRDTYWSTDDGAAEPELVLDLGRVVTFDVVSLREHLPLGQRVEEWALDSWSDGTWREFARGIAIGGRRLWRGADVTTDRVRLRITRTPVAPAVAELSLHREPEGPRSLEPRATSDRYGK
jgi:alpha-L-fucosidase